MSRYIFLFDLETTIIGKEILPVVSRRKGMYEKMTALTERMVEENHSKKSFLQRVQLLKHIPVSEVSEIVEDMELNSGLVKFMQKNKDRCFIITNNLDIWIDRLVKRIRMEGNVYCSKALVCNDYIEDVFCVVDKSVVVSQMVVPFVAVGSGNDDIEMIKAAEIGIGFGEKQNVSLSVLECATHAIYDEKKLIDFLQRLL